MNKIQRELLYQAKVDVETAIESYEKGRLRAACSRGYYAMFYVARAILLTDGLEFSKHSALISAFGKKAKDDETIPSTLHKEILFAFKRRGTADYEFGDAVEITDVQLIIASAQKFVELGNRILGDVSLEDEQ